MATAMEEPGAGIGAAAREPRPARLPDLSGRPFLAVRLLWAALLLLAVVAPLAGLHFGAVHQREQVNPYNDLGLRSDNRLDGARLGPPHGREARAQGLRAGGRILTVNGRPVADRATRREVAAMLSAAPSPVALTVRTAGGELRGYSLPRRAGMLGESFRGSGLTLEHREFVTKALRVATSTFAVVTGALLGLRRPRDPVAMLLSLAFLAYAASQQPAQGTWFALGLGGVGATIYALFRFCLLAGVALFPTGSLRPRWTAPLIAAAAAWYAADVIDFFLFQGIPTAVAQGVNAVLLGLAVLAVVLRFRELAPGAERQQIRWSLLGFAFGTLAAFLGWASGAFLYEGFADERVKVWGLLFAQSFSTLSLAAMAGGLLIALLRYRLYDAEAAISRSAAVAVLTVALAAVYAGSSEVLGKYFEARFGREAGVWSSAIGAVVAVLLFVPLNARIQRWAERRFQSGLAHLRRDLPECVGDLRETAEPAELVAEVIERVQTGVRASRAALVLGGEVAGARGAGSDEVASWLAGARLDGACDTLAFERGDPFLPVRLKLCARHGRTAEPVGWLLLGPRPDGSLYGRDEREALAEVADPVARALQVSLARERNETAREARFRALEDALQRAMATLSDLRPGKDGDAAQPA